MEAVENLWKDSDELPPYGLLEISSVEKVDMAKIPHAKSGIPALDKLIGGLYEGEVSVWTGKRKEGKSTMIGLPILSAIREGRKVCVYSGELPAWRYKAWLLTMGGRAGQSCGGSHGNRKICLERPPGGCPPD